MVSTSDGRSENFVHEYFYGIRRGIAIQSAILAGFTAKTAHKKSGSWVGKSRQKSSNKTTWDLVQAEKKKISDNYGITERELMDGYIRDQRFDIRKLVKDDGSFINNLKDLDDDTALSLVGVEITETVLAGSEGAETVLKRNVKLKLPDKKANRDSMAKVKGMFVERREITGRDGGPIEAKYTYFPKEPASIEDWQAQCSAADRKNQGEATK